jgi:hypothetical protein
VGFKESFVPMLPLSRRRSHLTREAIHTSVQRESKGEGGPGSLKPFNAATLGDIWMVQVQRRAAVGRDCSRQMRCLVATADTRTRRQPGKPPIYLADGKRCTAGPPAI